MKKNKLIIILIVINLLNVKAQDPTDATDDKGGGFAPDTAGYSHDQYNYPSCGGLDFKIVTCRREFPDTSQQRGTRKRKFDITKFSDPTLIPYQKLYSENRWQLLQLVSITKDKKYYNLLAKLALDTKERVPDRREYIKHLAIYAPNSKEIFEKILNDSIKELGVYAAYELVEFGKYDKAFHFLKTYHSVDPLGEAYQALAKINTSDALKELMRIAKEDRQPGEALSNVSYFSLRYGLCNFAFEVYKEFAKSKHEHVREMVVACLAYYIGSPEAFRIIEQMKNDPSEVVKIEVDRTLSIYGKD
jgi:hypothetical protein